MAGEMINLSQAQKQIVHADIGGAMQVLASAGTGKTRVLTERIRYIIEHTKKDAVIALTFTNKASEEMLSRLSEVQDIEDRSWVGTIHSVAQRILEQYGHTIGLPSELHIFERDQDRKAIFLQSLRDAGTDIDMFLNVSGIIEKSEQEKIINQYMTQFSVVKRELLNENEIEKKYQNHNGRFLEIYRAYQEALLESGGIDFDDILIYSNRTLLEQQWCAQIYRAKYKHICIDEAQDLNKAHYEFVKSFCGDQIKSVLMVGDPNQMIYGFNGSSEEFLCDRFPEDFAATPYKLKENYRSSKQVIRLANKLKNTSKVESNFALEGKAEFVNHLQDEHMEATWIADKIQDLLACKIDEEIEGEISLERMVIIGRNRYVFQAQKKVLRERNIEFFLNKAERLPELSSVFATTLDQGIRLRLNPKNWVAGKKLCAALEIQEPQSWGSNHILESFAKEVDKGNLVLKKILTPLLTSIQNLNNESPNFLKLCKQHNDHLQKLARVTSDENILRELERSLQELNEFSSYWSTFRQKGTGDTLGAFLNAMALGQLTKNNSTAGLTLSAVHTMKGLEKDIVFLMGMNEGTFPDYRAQKRGQIEEERNSAFVAITRSRRWIYITYPKSKIMPWGDHKSQKESRFITQMKKFS